MGDRMKTEQKQGFSSFDIVTIVLSMLVVILISAPIIYSSSGVEKIEKAQEDLVQFGQILQQDLKQYISSLKQAKRSIASVQMQKRGRFEGVIGEDPWGNPYFYKTQRDAYGKPEYIIVWSKGANLEQDTPDIELRSSPKGQFRLKGDDLGHIIAL